MTISERIGAARRERRVLARVCRAAWRLEQAGRERTWALVSARAEGISIRTLAAAAGLSPSRVRQIVAAADLDALDAALGELRAAGWTAPEDPDSGEDTELDGRDSIADRLSDEVSWLRQCADWLSHLDADSYPPAVNLRPSADWPDRAIVAAGLARVRAVIDRIAADLDELARARRVQDLTTAAVLPDPRAERRRRLAEPDLEFRAFCTRLRLPASSTRGPETIRPRNSSTDWSRRSKTSENNWFGEVLAGQDFRERGPGRPIRPAQRFREQGPGSSASPLELISGPIVPGPQHEETPWHYVTVSPPALLGARDFFNSETGTAEAGKAQVLGLDDLERPQGTLGLFIISQSAKPWKASFRLVTWVICSRSRGSDR